MEEILKDERFKHIVHDPRFRRIPKRERKVMVDKRFQSMFKDKRFNVKYTVDKRGRPVFNSSGEDLKRYYDISSEESESDTDSEEKLTKKNKAPTEENLYENSLEAEQENSSDTDSSGIQKSSFTETKKTKKVSKKKKKNSALRKSVNVESCDSESEIEPQETNASELLITEEVRSKLQDSAVDYARGEGVLFSSSSSDEDDMESGEEDNDDELEHGWGELDQDAGRTDEATARLALCNMDWDRIRAEDLMILFNSFLPPGGLIKSVTIYPSEFGLKRLQEEELKGPPELVGSGASSDEEEPDENEDEEKLEGDAYHMEKLRQYQLNRLKYYYAVIVFDSAKTADKVYSDCDGLEYESSATRLDLRFIPDGVTFDQDPKEICESLPDPSKYQPRFFTTTALQQAKVRLTWDETDPKRVELTKKLQSSKLNDLDDIDLRNYLASSDSEPEESIPQAESKEINGKEEMDDPTDEDPISKYKALLQDIRKIEEEKKSRDVEMEITWGLGMKDKAEKLVQKKIKENKEEEQTPFQQYLEKRKEKKKLKKLEKMKKKKQTEDEESSAGSSDNLYSDDDIPSDIDMNDPYFAEELQGMKSNKKGKQKKDKKMKKGDDSEESENSKLNKAELELLLMNEESEKNHFSLKAIQEQESLSSNKKKKKLKKKKAKGNEEELLENDNFEVNVNDERFSALYTSHHFNIDPADSHYKKTKAMETLRAEKLKRRKTEKDDVMPEKVSKVEKPKKDYEIHRLISSVKLKTKKTNEKR